MLLFDNSFITLKLISNKQVILATWLADSDNMTTSLYKEVLLEYQQKCLDYKVRKTIWDSRQMDFSISVDLQEWTNETFKPLLNMGTIAMGIITSKDLFTQISIEQVMSEYISNQINQSFFENYEDAEKWISQF